MLCYKDRTIHDGNGEKYKSSSRTERRSEGSSGRLLQLPRGGLAEVQPANPVHRQRFACAAHVSSTLQHIYTVLVAIYTSHVEQLFFFFGQTLGLGSSKTRRLRHSAICCPRIGEKSGLRFLLLPAAVAFRSTAISQRTSARLWRLSEGLEIEVRPKRFLNGAHVPERPEFNKRFFAILRFCDFAILRFCDSANLGSRVLGI